MGLSRFKLRDRLTIYDFAFIKMETRVTAFPSIVRHRDLFLYDTVSNAKYVQSRDRSRRFGLGIWRSLKCFYPSIWHFRHVSEIGRDGRVVLDHLPYCEEILSWVLFPARSDAV
jgi:hypothetical protein